MTTLRERLRWARNQRGWSAQQLATLADVHLVTVQRIEASPEVIHIEKPRRVTIGALARALRVNKDWLASGTGKPGGGLPDTMEDAPAAE